MVELLAGHYVSVAVNAQMGMGQAGRHSSRANVGAMSPLFFEWTDKPRHIR
jgi:hypothetical protein